MTPTETNDINAAFRAVYAALDHVLTLADDTDANSVVVAECAEAAHDVLSQLHAAMHRNR